MRREAPQLRIAERAVLRKYDGDDTSGTPVEVLVAEDGLIVDRWTPEEDRPCPQ